MQVEKLVTGYLQENCYILIKGDECLVIDPGSDYPFIKNRIEDKKVVGILLTHSHFDHIGAVDDLVKDYKVDVYSYKNLDEGNKIISKFNFDVILTPGHSSDSITFYFKEDKIMFTGDFLFKENIGRCDLPTGNISVMKKSLNKIKTYDDEITIYPGHGEMSTLKYEKDNNQYLFTNF